MYMYTIIYYNILGVWSRASYIYIYILYVYICIYVYREREREIYICIYTYIYIYIYILLAKGQVPRSLREPRGTLAFGREFTKGGLVKGGLAIRHVFNLHI